MVEYSSSSMSRPRSEHSPPRSPGTVAPRWPAHRGWQYSMQVLCIRGRRRRMPGMRSTSPKLAERWLRRFGRGIGRLTFSVITRSWPVRTRTSLMTSPGRSTGCGPCVAPDSPGAGACFQRHRIDQEHRVGPADPVSGSAGAANAGIALVTRRSGNNYSD